MSPDRRHRVLTRHDDDSKIAGPANKSVTTSRDSAADTGVHEKNPHAAALGRLGGLKGGRARANSLSAARRRAIARKAARARWHRSKN